MFLVLRKYVIFFSKWGKYQLQWDTEWWSYMNKDIFKLKFRAVLDYLDVEFKLYGRNIKNWASERQKRSGKPTEAPA